MYFRSTVSGCRVLALVTAIGLIVPAAGAVADLPADQILTYSIRENPDDEQSDVIWTVEFRLEPVNAIGNSVAWETTQVVIEEIGSNGTTLNEWTDTAPAFGTAGRLWWIEHADPEDPKLTEFDMLPSIDGTTDADDPNNTDLDYEFEGGACDTSCQQMYGGTGVALTYTLTMEGENQPEEDEEDEPAESDLIEEA